MSSFVVGCKKNKINNIRHIKNFNNITSCNALSTICGAAHTIREASVVREKHDCTKIPDMTIPNNSQYILSEVSSHQKRKILPMRLIKLLWLPVLLLLIIFCLFFRRGLERKASISSYCSGLRWVS